MIDDVMYTMLIIVAFIINLNLIYHFVRTVISKHERGWVSHFKMGLETIIWLVFIILSIGVLDIYHEWLVGEKMMGQFDSMSILFIMFIQVPLIVMNLKLSVRWTRILIFYMAQKKDTPYNRLLKSQRHIDSINDGEDFIKTLNEMRISDVEHLQNLDCITETNIMKAILHDDIKNEAVKKALKLKIMKNDQSVKESEKNESKKH
ncbi:hypothetical protein [Mammaliicoccus sciuri]|uniref:Uncharacterized protein n=1 Tax=Mammaliicoccus sciuri TaxID=1296 RepID=A0AAI8DJL3_MAMSC|nr:hypothetical protein [Mammaliicoccus sciuri]ASE35672.1 hypothetical protein CEP64_13705 [Mammaliicoccus sciuri]